MNLLFIIPFLFTNIITKTISVKDTIFINTTGEYVIKYTKSNRVIVETTYENNAPYKLQEYIKKRYSIEYQEINNRTIINIFLPKNKIIYHGKQIEEKFSSIIYCPEGIDIE
jgi:hypothetical protein